MYRLPKCSMDVPKCPLEHNHEDLAIRLMRDQNATASDEAHGHNDSEY